MLKDTIATPTGEISRKVFDIDYMMLYDGFQYGMVKLQGTERSVRRVRSSNDTWELLEECKDMIVKEWGILGQNK